MKQYPSFDGKIVDGPMTAFDKLDGQNVRCEWNRKQGLHKFGTRKVLLGEDHPVMGRAIALTQDKYGDALGRIFRDERFEEVTCFFEFYGPRSFAGGHHPDDAEAMTTTLIDIDIYKKGMPLATAFRRLFEDKVEIPAVLWVGNPTQEFLASVKAGTLPGMGGEGVVCKGAPLKKGYQPYMYKVKTVAWIERVRALYGADPERLRDLL